MKHALPLLLALVAALVWVACSRPEVSPNQPYFGYYDYYMGGSASGIPGPDLEENFPPGYGRVHVQEAPDELISIRILENVGRTRTFERCRVLPIDTTGNKYQHFARIINNENQEEIAKIRHWYVYNNGIYQPPLVRVYIQFDFIADNQRIEINAIKRKE